MTTNECRVYFALDGEHIDSEAITKLLGIIPTKTSKNTWELSTPNVVNQIVDVYELSKQVVCALIEKKQHILKAQQQFGVTARLQVVLWLTSNEEDPLPAIGFDVETLVFLAEVEAFIDVDTYR